MIQCPNCKCDEVLLLHLLHQACELRKCAECGTTWFDGSRFEAHIPRRSQPATVLPLPDTEGWWWQFDSHNEEWKCFNISMRSSGVPNYGSGMAFDCACGRYVRAESPIVAAEKDAEVKDDWLKRFHSLLNSNRIASAMCLLADRLEAAEKGKFQL
jgi:Zn-finger nucleic acid-binding protein